MRRISLILLVFLAATRCVFADDDDAILHFKAKIGFMNGEDKIVEYKFIDKDKKLVIIGEKVLQIWDVENARMLSSAAHRIPQFAPRGFVSTYLLLGVPRLLDWRSFLIDADGKWIITIEKTDTRSLSSAVVRDLRTLRQIAVLDLPNVATDYVSFDDARGEIRTFGITDKNAAFGAWNPNGFALKESVSIKEYKWRQTIRADAKMIVGTGDTKTSWSGFGDKQGDRLTLRDAKTGAVEREFAAPNLQPESAYQTTTVSADEKFLISKRDERIFVWDIDGGGAPAFEISNPKPKGNLSLKEICDGKFIVVKIDDELRVYDVAGGGVPLLAISKQNPKEDLDFARIIGGRFVVVEAGDKIRLYDVRNGQTLKLEIASDNPKDSVHFYGATTDGKFFVVRDDRKISVFETAGGAQPIYEIVRRSEKERFPTVKFIEDKNLLAVARVNRSEKKPPTTEFYDAPTGKILFDASFEAGYDMKFTPGGKYIYQTELGAFSVWNVAARKFFALALETYTPSSDPNTIEYLTESPRNTESVDFSPDFRYILRHGGNVTAVFETETGRHLQTIFNPDKVKYDKRSQIKKSGLGYAAWINDGKYVFALDAGNFFGGSKTISLWEVKK